MNIDFSKCSDFQRMLFEKLESELNDHSIDMDNLKLNGKNEIYLEGRISKVGLRFWIYEDGAEFTNNDSDYRYERYDFNSLDELASRFLKDIVEQLFKYA